jgi:surface antigen
VRPKTGSILEYVLPDGRGHVAFVEAVFPDETINISETDYPEGGGYNERVMTQEEWRELKPVFIQIT